MLPAVGDTFRIAMKVRLADVISTDVWESVHGRRIAQKHLDYLLVSPKQTRITAAVELKDSSHQRQERMERDRFVAEALAAAWIPLIEFPIYQTYDPRKIRRRILSAVNTMKKDNARRKLRRASH